MVESDGPTELGRKRTLGDSLDSLPSHKCRRGSQIFPLAQKALHFRNLKYTAREKAARQVARRAAKANFPSRIRSATHSGNPSLPSHIVSSSDQDASLNPSNPRAAKTTSYSSVRTPRHRNRWRPSRRREVAADKGSKDNSTHTPYWIREGPTT